MKVNKHDIPLLVAEAVLYGMSQDIDLGDESQLQEFELRRQNSIDLAVDKHRSQATKIAWKRDRSKYQRSINRFHKSADGKRFHRALGRFNARKSADGKQEKTPGELDREQLSKERSQDRKSMRAESRDIIALSSLKTSLNICNEYLVPGAASQIEWDAFYEHVNRELTEILRVSESGESMSEDQHQLVHDLLSPVEISKLREDLMNENQGHVLAALDSMSIDFS